ncbi:MAG TPA: hypothetical protein VM118_09560 [Acidobacteriota bacterium]|nr:hypothetical protein [Acidobacteriota bacterium]
MMRLRNLTRMASLTAGVILLGLEAGSPMRAEPACAGAPVLHLDRSRIVIDDSHLGDPQRRGICPEPSDRNLLGLERVSPFAPPVRLAGAAAQTALRVVAIRVDFPREAPDDPLTTGDGRFDLRDTATYNREEGHYLDSAPHNREYFYAHLRALGMYWNTVSNGRVQFDLDSSVAPVVFPVASDAAYTLPEPMAYYGTQVEGDSVVIIDRLRQFVVDAVTTASDAEPALMFSDYDAIIIFHAGADGQSDVAGDTPRDLFSGFLKLSEPLLLRNAIDTVYEAMIMPETEVQDGRITVLNAVLAHEFGHQLGLVDLYNTDFASPFAWATQIGNFSLMDNNGANIAVWDSVGSGIVVVHGALPVYPDAWSRVYLGFLDVTILPPQQNTAMSVWAAEGLNHPQVWKVPISETEYYLLENRQQDLDDLEPSLRLDSATNVVLGPAGPPPPEPEEGEPDPPPPDFTREYDFLLPGRGLLIWHIDEAVAAADFDTTDDVPNNFLANTLQWDRHHRFVRLIEADGLQQLGGIGINSIYTGTAYDYYPHGGVSELSASTNPSARSYTGAATGIRLVDIRDLGERVSLSGRLDGPLPGFPVYAGLEPGAAGAVVLMDGERAVGDWLFPGDGRPEILAAYQNYILGWNWDGSPLSTATVVDPFISFDMEEDSATLHPIAIAPGVHEWIAPPLIYDPQYQTGQVIAVSRNRDVFVWDLRIRDGDSLLALDYTVRTSDVPVASPALWRRDNGTVPRDVFVPVANARYDLIEIASGTRTTHDVEGTIRGAAGRSLGEAVGVFRTETGWDVGSLDAELTRTTIEADSLFPPVLGDLDRSQDGKLETIVLDAAGRLHALDSVFMPLSGFPVNLYDCPDAAPVLADVNRDGYLDILVVGGGRLYAYAHNGTLLPNFPVNVGPASQIDSALVAPVVGDFGRAGSLSILTGGASRTISGIDGDGRVSEGMPRAVGGTIDAPAAWAMNTSDNEAAVFVRADDGFLYAYEVPPVGETPALALWPTYGRDPHNSRMIPSEDLEPVDIPTDFFIAERAFVYPNPASAEARVRYWVGQDADVSIRIYDFAGDKVAEWHGSGSAGVYNEWIWPCDGAASGVYFARLELTPRDGGATETVFCKMSVVQ